MKEKIPTKQKMLKARFSTGRFRAAAGAILLAAIGVSPTFGAQGLNSLYYNNPTLTGTGTPRVPTDTTINFTTLTPPSPIGANNFSARWTGQIKAGRQAGAPLPESIPAGSFPLTYLYKFRVDSNNGVRLWVNGKLVIDSWIRPQGPSQTEGEIRLAPDFRYDIKLEYRDTPTADTPSVRLQWSYPGLSTLHPIPASHLFTDRQGLLAEYYANPKIVHDPIKNPDQGRRVSDVLNNLVFARTDPTIDYAFGNEGSPDPSLERDSFGMRWTGNIRVSTAGDYTFHVTIAEPPGKKDARERVKLLIAGQEYKLDSEYPDDDAPLPPYNTTRRLPVGNVPIVMEYGGSVINDQIKLEWSCPAAGITRQVIGQNLLTPPANSDVNMRLEERRFPFNAGVINVKTYYGADGGDQNDDTAALQRAITENIGWTAGFSKWLYLPAGTYYVRDTLKWYDPRSVSIYHRWRGGLGLIGDGEGQTIIKLIDGSFPMPAPPATPPPPKAVIMTGSGLFSTSNGVTRDIGEGNEGARNNLVDLTIDTGSNNGNAIGVDYIASNRGYINNVTIRSGDGKGIAGLSMKRRYPGPALGTNLTIEGFDYGIDMSWFDLVRRHGAPEYGMTFDGLILRNQNIAGIYYQENTLQIRNLICEANQPVPAILNPTSHGQGFIAVVDGTFRYTGTLAAPSAIRLTNSRIFLRNIASNRYTSVLHGDTRQFVDEGTYLYVNDKRESPIGKLFPEDNETKSLNLRVPATPTFDDRDLNNWVDVTSFGADFTDRKDDTAAIQRAIDSFIPPNGVNSSKTTLYFPTNGGGLGKSLPAYPAGGDRTGKS